RRRWSMRRRRSTPRRWWCSSRRSTGTTATIRRATTLMFPAARRSGAQSPRSPTASNKGALLVKHLLKGAAALAAASVLVGCARAPLGPTVAVMPAANKPFPVFQQEDAYCRNFAQQQTAGTAEAANNAQLGTAVIGTVLGAGLGAALGGGHGAAVGAGA